jgi:dienelactone hydrolase
MTTPATKLGRTRAYAYGLVLLALVAAAAYHSTRLHLEAVSLLFRIEKEHGAIAGLGTQPFDEQLTTISTPNGPVSARLYAPRGVAHAPGMVIVHGVHHLGIEEPRLVNFSRALAAGGVAVLTPELQSLADYRIDQRDVATIGAAANTLRQRLGARVGVLGLSFAGGLSLLAAADPQFADNIGYVVAIGAHDDLARVLRFFATGEIARPDGTTQHVAPHEYGVLVAVYSHPEDFFAPADVPAARESIRLQLWEQGNKARARAAQLSPAGRQLVAKLLTHNDGAIGAELLARIPAHVDEIARVSPHGKLGQLRVPVLLLHGSGDSVIPPSETEWLAREIPPGLLREVLISPLITHVEVGRQPGFRDKAALIDFMATMLSEVERTRPR